MEFNRAEMTRYLHLVYEKRHIAILLCVVIMSLIVWGSYFLPKKYKAKSTIFIERNVIEDLVSGIAITPSMDARIRVIRDTMLRRGIILNVLRQLDLDTGAKNAKELEAMIKDFKRRTHVSVRKSSLVHVAFVSKYPDVAQKYVNTLVSEYVEESLFAKREEAYDATKFIKNQVAFFKGKIDIEEEKIIKFRQEQGIYVGLDESTMIEEIKKHEVDLEDVMMKSHELKAALQSTERQLKGEEPFTVSITSRGGGGSLRALKSRLNQLLIRYTENYPEVIKVKAEIESLENQGVSYMNSESDSEISMANPIYQEIKQRLMETESQINSLDAKGNHLLGLIKKKKAMLGNIPENRKKLNDMIQEKNSYIAIHSKLMERLGQSQVSKQMEVEDKSTTFRIIEPAVLPTIPISPPRVALILAGILLGIAGGLGVIVIMDRLDNSIKTIDDLKTLGIPVLAIIPRIQVAGQKALVSGKDIFIYSLAGLYFICIVGVLVMELLGMTYVDDFFSNLFTRSLYS